ncbi:MAG: hypothetical protein Q8K65_03305 [Alphaproteobacteria bacterium]|nr:hypothetical protein [Alphaproteobacteria bacterium]
MTTAADDNGTGVIEAGEYQLYSGLDKVFGETQMLSTTSGIKNRLGLLVIEMDQSLRAFEAGDKTAALGHHEKMLGYYSAVIRETDTLGGRSEQAKAEGALNVAPDVRVLLTTLMATDAIVKGTENIPADKNPWAKTLDAVSEAYKQQRAAEIAKITLAPAGAPLSVPAKTEKSAFIEKIVLGGDGTPASRFALAEFEPPKETVWTRREYKNLSIVLEGIRKSALDSTARVQATVALSCLKAVNNREIDLLARQRGRKPAEDAEAAKDVKEYAGRLAEYVGKLKGNGAVQDGMKANLKRFAPAAQTAAEGLKKTLGKGSGILSRAFRFAMVVGARLIGPGQGQKPALSAQKPQDPQSH